MSFATPRLKWITASKCEPAKFQYPDKMLAPDKPFVTPDQAPLVLKISDRLSLKCLWVPSGRFLMGEIEYISSEPSPPKTYPGVVRFRVVVEGQ